MADAAGGHVLDVLPAGGFVGATACAFAGEAHTREALAGGEHDAAVLVDPGVAFDLLHHWELHAVDGDPFIACELEGLGHQHVDLHQGLAVCFIGAQGAVRLPGEDQAHFIRLVSIINQPIAATQRLHTNPGSA